MIQINPREVATEAMMQIMTEGAYNTITLRRLLRQNGAMQKQEKAFVTEIVNGTLRNIVYIDYVIGQFSNTKIQKIKPWILAVLRTAVYQILFLTVPDNAACNEAVKLVNERGYKGLSGFVNGLLRTIARKKQNMTLPEENTAEYLHIVYSHPLWLVKMWIAYYGYAQTEALCKANNISPDVTIRINTTQINQTMLQEMLEKEQISVQKGVLCAHALRLTKTADLTKSMSFQNGLFHVQDESSQLAVAVLAPKPEQKILDICAAPGGKSFTIAQMMENKGEVVARDIYAHKVDLIAEGAKRLGLSIVHTEVHDATVFVEKDKEAFDAVLADVPCSCLGLLRKKPDIRLKKDGSEIDNLIPIQRKILEQAAMYVKTGGVLLYSTCTLSKKENEKNVEWFLQNHPEYTLEDMTPYLPKQMADMGKQGYLTVFPHIHHTDGFFIARLKKKG